ncbi:hypothetical protein FRC07_014098, partial [Ceratobasidium sp. 392]
MAHSQNHVNFEAPRGNWTERLNEWCQQTNRVVSWDYENVGTKSHPTWKATPVYKRNATDDTGEGKAIPECAAQGSRQKDAMALAAQKLSTWVFE